MTAITTLSDLLWDSAGDLGIVGQSPYKKISRLDILNNWVLTDKLNDLRMFEFSVRNDDFEKENILLERNITIPLLTPFKGIITSKEPLKDSIKFKVHELAWHLTRRKFRCHDKRRIRFTKKDWYNPLWKLRRNIKIHAKFLDWENSALTNQALLFKTTDPELKEHALSNGFDILFTQIDKDGNVNKLSHEIEKYVISTGELIVWIKFPELRPGSDVDFQMYFGNPDAADQQDVSGTWDTKYKMVQHLNGNSIDSTSNNNDGSDISITYGTSKINLGDNGEFDGVNSKIDCGSGSSMDNIFSGGGTYWVVIEPRSDGEANLALIIGKETGTNTFLQIREEVNGFCKLRFFRSFTTINGDWITTNAIVPINKRSFISVEYDESDFNNVPIITVNGIIQPITTSTQPTVNDPVSDVGDPLLLGNESGNTRTFDGFIDEVRLIDEITSLSGMTSSKYLSIIYSNQFNNSNWFEIGQVEEYIRQADKIAERILESANRDMPELKTTNVPAPIAWWKLDGSAKEEISGTVGTWVGTDSTIAEKYVSSIYGGKKAALFDISNLEYIDSGIDSGLDIISSTQPFSISFIHTMHQENTAGQVLSKGLQNGPNAWDVRINTTGEYRLRLTDTNTTNDLEVKSDGGFINANDLKPHKVLFTYDGSENASGVKCFIDGQLHPTIIASDTLSSGVITNNVNFFINASGTPDSQIDGVTEEIRIYDRQLTSKEAIAIQKQTFPSKEFLTENIQWKLGDGKVTEIPGLISLWKFDQNVLDSKSSNHGNIIGTEQYDDFKYNGKGFKFNGSTRIEFDESGFSDFRTTTQPKSFTTWINTTNTAGTQSLFYKITPAGNPGLYFFISAGNFGFAELIAAGTDELDVRTTGITFNDGKDHLLGVSYDGGQDETDVHLFLDGVELGSTNRSVFDNTLTTVNYAGNYPVSVGGRVDGTVPLSDGTKLDDFRAYNVSLTPEEHKRIYEATDSAIDRFRDDNIPTKLLEIEFNHKNHLESLQKVAKESGTDLYFNSNEFKVFIRTKGKKIKPVFDTIEVAKPKFDLDSVANIVNILGNKKLGIQREKTFETTNSLKYSYEQTYSDNQIATDDTANLIGEVVLEQFKELNPDLTISAPYDQFVKEDLVSGDRLNINEIEQDLQGVFRISKIKVKPQKVEISLNRDSKALIHTAGVDISDLINNLIKTVTDIQTIPE